jgi:O-succinylbenzoate synthase
VTADWLPYALPLCTPWQTSRGRVTVRRGRLLRLRGEDGLIGWGDCAPLPEFGIDESRAVAFAEECAQLDLAAQRAGQALDAWLSGNPPVGALAVNASLGKLTATSAADACAAGAAGFKVLKLKVGSAPVADEIRYLYRLAAALPADCRLRLDANGAWNIAEARNFLAACRDLPVDACEEPLAVPEAGELARLQATVPFALAVDESLDLLGAAFFHHPPVRRIVIKPVRLGGLLATMAIALRARTAGVEMVISSALESSCGLLACAHLAAAAAPTAVHGLATASWFVSDTGMPPLVQQGQLILPGKPGLGFHWAGDTAPAVVRPA